MASCSDAMAPATAEPEAHLRPQRILRFFRVATLRFLIWKKRMGKALVVTNASSTTMVTTTQAPSVDRRGPILPPEITDQVIDNLRGEQNALRQCALTCRAWRPRSQLCLNHTVTIHSRAALKAFGAHLRDGRCLPYLHSLFLDQAFFA
ncbi:hypothetical protein B0H21DRAFT_34499 [Amylocystis lapponica]|nr:hypothetical protein B0H21DRAFT_34499 [Amylocystis lapponica]